MKVAKCDSTGRVDWKSFISQHDLIYERAPKIWADGFAIGNGALGALVYAPFHPEWVINKNDVYDYRKPKPKVLSHREYLEFLKRGGTAEELNRLESLDDRGPYPTPKTCASLRLAFGRDSTWVGPHLARQRLSLHEACVRTELDKHLSHPRIESFVHPELNILAIRLSQVSWAENSNNRLELFWHPDAALSGPKLNSENDVLSLDQTMPDGFRYSVVVKVIPKEGSTYEAWVKKHIRPQYWPQNVGTMKTSVEGDRALAGVVGDMDIFLAVVTSLEADDPHAEALSLVEKASRLGYSKLFEEHRRHWAEFWQKSFVKLDDPFLEQLWYFSLYQLASSYGKVPVPGLCGLWYGPNDQPVQVLPWYGTYTNDQNSEMPPMPLFSSNHVELARSFYQTFNRMIPIIKEETRAKTGLDGIWFPTGCDPTGKDLATGQYRYIHVGGPYHGLIYVWGYRYTQNVELLRDLIYPFLREVCIFFAEYMTFDKKSRRYRLWPSVPAEQPFPGSANPTQTLTLLKVCLEGAVESAEILKVDADRVKKWKDILENYPEYPVDHGILLEAEGNPWNHYVTQYGALYTVFPAGEFGEDSPKKIRDLLRRTYESYSTRFTMQSYADEKGRHFFNGWSAFFAAMQALRMGWKEKAREILFEQVLRCFLKPNGLFTHNSVALANPGKSEANLKNVPKVKIRDRNEWMPLIEPMHSNAYSECTPDVEAKETVFSVHEMSSAYLTLVNEMLLQSHGGRLRLFPGAAKDFTGAFRTLRAEGAFLVSSAMEKGKVSFVTVKSLKGGNFSLVNPWPKRKVFMLKNGRKEILKPEREFHFQTRAGERLTFYADPRAYQKAAQRVFRAERAASPKVKRFSDGTRAWLGKPKPEEYYKW